jgi:DNA-binding FadR family transcriptional regulator
LDKGRSTLADAVEDILIKYFKDNGLKIGDSIPSETELAKTLGVGRPVIREALSRLKMVGMVVSRTKRGMILSEPSLFGGMKNCINPLLMTKSTMRDILGLRVALEIGISDSVISNITDEDISELEKIVAMSEVVGINDYDPLSEHRFHTKLYEITGNKYVSEFQTIIYPVINFIKSEDRGLIDPIKKELSEEGKIVTHADLLDHLKKRDRAGYKIAIEDHLRLYSIYLQRTCDNAKAAE